MDAKTLWTSKPKAYYIAVVAAAVVVMIVLVYIHHVCDDSRDAKPGEAPGGETKRAGIYHGQAVRSANAGGR